MQSPLRQYRTEKGLSLEALAPEFGISKYQLSRIECGYPTSLETALLIERKTGVKVGPLANASTRDIKAIGRVLLSGGAA